MAQFIFVTPQELKQALDLRISQAHRKYQAEIWQFNRRQEARKQWSEQHRKHLNQAFAAMQRDYELKFRLVFRPRWLNSERTGFRFYHQPRQRIFKIIAEKTALVLDESERTVSLPMAPFDIGEKPVNGALAYEDAYKYVQAHLHLSILPVYLSEAAFYGLEYDSDQVQEGDFPKDLVPEYRLAH